MLAVASVDNTINVMNKLSSTIQTNIAIQNKYINQTQQHLRLSQQNFKFIDQSDKSKHITKNKNKVTLNFITQVTKEVETKEKFVPDPALEERQSKPNLLKLIPSLALQGLQSMFGRVKGLWDGWLGKGLKLGISQDEEVSVMMSAITEKWNKTWSDMGARIAPLLKPMLKKVSELMDSEAFQNMVIVIETIVVAIVNGIGLIMNYLSPVIDWLGNIFGVLAEHSDTVIVTIFILIGVLGVLTVATAIYNAVLNANPVMLVVQGIIILISIFIALITTLEPVRKAIADLTRGFFNFIEWGINGLIEGLASAAEGIIRFAGDGINTFLDIFVNPFVDGVNLIIDGLNLFGANMEKVKHFSVDFSMAAEATGTFIRKGKIDLSGAREAVAGAIENFNGDAFMSKLGIGSIKGRSDQEKPIKTEVTKINDDVNIADEDIKLMREVAEREMIQNFVTLTPTVSMGDMTVNENADADKLLGKITEALVTEVANSAQGVYA